MRSCARLKFVESTFLEGQKRGVVLGDEILVSPAIYSLLKGPEATEVLNSLELLEAEPAKLPRRPADFLAKYLELP